MRPTLALLSILLLATQARAQSTSALLNEALDKQTNLQLDTVLPQAMKQIAKDTGVNIEAGPAVWDLLPWGEQTKITANIKNNTLRDSLTAITRKLGLTFVLADNSVQLQPLPALARLGRRSTLQELQLLELLSATPYKGDLSRPTLRQVIDAVDSQLAATTTKTDFAVESRTPQGTVLESIIPIPRGATLADALEAIARSTSVTWYPWGKSLVILPKEDQIRVLLQKPINVRYTREDISQVLVDLSKSTGVEFSFEPGAVQRINPDFRQINLTVDNASVQQILEQLSGFTGLGYVVTEKGVYVWNNSPIPGGAPSPAAQANNAQPGRTTLLVPLDNGTQLIIPDGDIPDDVKQYLHAKRDAELQHLRDKMKQDGFKPTTRPEERRDDL